MKKQIERVSTSNESSTSTYTTQIEIKAETQYLAQYDDSVYYYEEDHNGEEVENVETEDTYYIQPGTWSMTSCGTCVASKPMGRLKNTPLDEFGNPASCRLCKSIYHWVDQCPDDLGSVKNVNTRDRRDYTRRNARYYSRDPLTPV